MFESVERRNSFVRVESEQFGDKILGLCAHLGPLWLVDGVLSREHGLYYLLISAAVERRVPAEQNIKNDTAAPKIALLIVALFQNFGRNIIRRAILLAHLLLRIKHARCTKVDNGDSWVLALLIEEQILRLQVTMHDVARMAVVNGR